MILFSIEFDIIKEQPIDDEKIPEGLKLKEAEISWQGNGEFFAVNFSFGKGFKCLTRDVNLDVFKSLAKSDPEEDGLVKSVAEVMKVEL